MISPLRRRHRLMWMIIGVILPVLFLIAVFNVPEFPYDTVAKADTQHFEQAAFQEDLESFSIEIGKNNDGSIELSFDLKKAFNSPAVGVYISNNNDIKGAQFLFAIGDPKVYSTKLDNMSVPNNIIIYDQIHKKILSSINTTK
ncbi:hypothetical protein QQ008_18530 [Fulvivirgaceae bacterium BMA10]|uniref:Uncharacterized protein n=1 Tax=Splendidivirga corallicola TaxID=3051826 RepID=A0ABT8KRN0_9BACT|nr:hypothetical protein [Fulvivirgaceae bacterium BMA10]